MNRPSNQGSGATLLLLLSVLAASCLVATARPGSNVTRGSTGAIHFPHGPENATHIHSLAINSTSPGRSPQPFNHTANGEHTHRNGSQLALHTAASSSPQPLPEKPSLNHTHNHTNFKQNFTAEGLNQSIPAAPFAHGARGHAGGQHGRLLMQRKSTGQHAQRSGPLGVISSPRPVGSSSSPNPHSGQQHSQSLSSPHPHSGQQHSQALSSPHPQGAAAAAKHGRSLMQKAEGQHVVQQLGSEPRKDSPRPLVGSSSPHPAHNVPQAGSSSPHPAHNVPQAGSSSPHPAHDVPQAGSSSPHPAHNVPQAGSSSPQPGFQAGQRGHAGAPTTHPKQ